MAEGVQIGLGDAHQFALHVPVGVGIVGPAFALFVWSIAWRSRLGRRLREGQVR